MPYILRKQTELCTPMLNCGGHRPYIVDKTAERWTWRPYKPTPAEIVFTPEELAFAEPYRGKVMIEPNGKDIGHDNKLWPWGKWQGLVSLCEDMDFVQCAPPGARRLNGIDYVITPTFRHACAVMSVCRAFVGIEGGLMHAAAALNVDAVILWSEFIAPTITGYATMRNIRHAGKPCGMRTQCANCRKSMELITVLEVAQALKETLE